MKGHNLRRRGGISVFTAGLSWLLVSGHELNAQDRIQAVYQFPELSIKEFQNAKLPGSIVNDRKVLVGSVSSELWRNGSDPTGEFWMITDRGPNGQVRIDGRNRRTFWVPEFNPAILRVKSKVIRSACCRLCPLSVVQANR